MKAECIDEWRRGTERYRQQKALEIISNPAFFGVLCDLEKAALNGALHSARLEDREKSRIEYLTLRSVQQLFCARADQKDLLTARE